MTARVIHTIPYRHLIGAHLLVSCSDCGGELQRVAINPPRYDTREKHIIRGNCRRDYGQDTTEMLVEGGRP